MKRPRMEKPLRYVRVPVEGYDGLFTPEQLAELRRRWKEREEGEATPARQDRKDGRLIHRDSAGRVWVFDGMACTPEQLEAVSAVLARLRSFGRPHPLSLKALSGQLPPGSEIFAKVEAAALEGIAAAFQMKQEQAPAEPWAEASTPAPAPAPAPASSERSYWWQNI